MTRRDIEIHIESIAVSGVSGVGERDGEAIRTAIADELRRLVAAGGARALSGRRTATVQPRLDVAPGASARELGVGIARAVYRGGLS